MNVPQPFAAQQPASGPAPSAELCSVRELSYDGPHKLKSRDRILRHLADGSLHGHRDRDRRGVRWSIPLLVARAWKAGATPDEQMALCPLCALLAPVRQAAKNHASVTPLPRQRRPRRGT